MYPKVIFSSGLYESMDATGNVLTRLTAYMYLWSAKNYMKKRKMVES